MDILNNSLVAICGVGGVCCGGSLLVLFIAFRAIRHMTIFSFLESFLDIMNKADETDARMRRREEGVDEREDRGLIGSLLGGVLGGVGALFSGFDSLLGGDDTDEEDYDRRRRQDGEGDLQGNEGGVRANRRPPEQRPSGESRIQAKLRNADQDFQRALREHGVDPNNPDAYDLPGSGDDPNFGVNPSQAANDRKSEFGTRFDNSDPNRIIRDRRYRRNQGPSLGNASAEDPLEYGGADDARSNRMNKRRRDSRRRDDHDIIGYDEDGDGSVDY